MNFTWKTIQGILSENFRLNGLGQVLLSFQTCQTNKNFQNLGKLSVFQKIKLFEESLCVTNLKTLNMKLTM